MKSILAPFSKNQVDALWDWQLDKNNHPYTCTCGETLLPTINGFVCSRCPYTQNWCWDYTAEKKAKDDFWSVYFKD